MSTDLATLMDANAASLRALAPKYVNTQRLVALAIEARMRNPLLAQCTAESVLLFCKKCAETGTDRVGAGGMWAVPFRNNKSNTMEMVAVPDWRLLVEKAKKAKAISHAFAEVVHEHDVFSFARGTAPVLTHEPVLSNAGGIQAAYCVYILPDGRQDFVVMSKEEIEKVRGSSKAKDGGPWVAWPEEMAKKTVVKRAMKLFEGASIELTALIETDNSALGFDALPELPPIEQPKRRSAGTVSSGPRASKAASPQTPPPAGAAEGRPAAPRVPSEGAHDQQEDLSIPDDVIPGAASIPDMPQGPELDDAISIRGTLEDVQVKPGKKKDGSDFTRYGVNIDGNFYGTFDTKLGEYAVSLRATYVDAWYVPQKKNPAYFDLVRIQPVPAEG